MHRIRRGLQRLLAPLTVRGRSFLAAAVATTLCSMVLGQPELLRVTVLLAALPLLAAAFLTGTRTPLAVERMVTPERVVADEPVRVRLTVRNTGRLRTGVLLLQDEVVFARDSSPRNLLDGLPSLSSASVTYPVRAGRRGRYPIGPLRVGVTDPFGMVRIPRTVPGQATLTVVPPVVPLQPISGTGRGAAGGEGAIGAAAASGEDAVAVREYRHGDDLRRVHWRSTARRGDLMVRTDEQPRRLRATILLDNRPDAHHGEGASSSYEWAVKGVASIGVHLMGLRYGVRLLTDGRPTEWSDPVVGDGGGAKLLDSLAVVAPGEPRDLARALSVLDKTPDGLVVAVLGDLTDDEARAVARSRGTGGQGIAILIGTGERDAAHLSPKARVRLGSQRLAAAGLLRAAGWRVVEAHPEAGVAAVWARADAPHVVTAAGPGGSSTASGRTGWGR